MRMVLPLKVRLEVLGSLDGLNGLSGKGEADTMKDNDTIIMSKYKIFFITLRV